MKNPYRMNEVPWVEGCLQWEQTAPSLSFKLFGLVGLFSVCWSFLFYFGVLVFFFCFALVFLFCFVFGFCLFIFVWGFCCSFLFVCFLDLFYCR